MENTGPSAIRILKWAVFVFLLVICIGSGLAVDSMVKGTVTDEEGKPVQDARLTLSDPGTGLKFVLKTDKKGKFVKVGIPPSTYKTTIEAEGYLTFESEVKIRFGMEENLEIKVKKTLSPTDKDLIAGSDAFRDGKYDQAIAGFQKVIEKFPSNYEGYYNLGLSYMKKKEMDPAIAALEKAAELNPQSLDTVFALGECFFMKGDIEKALVSFSRAVELKPESVTAHYDLGLAYYKLNKNEEALCQFEKAIELNPAGGSSYYQAAMAAIRLENYAGAIDHFEKFLKLDAAAPEAPQVKAMLDELRKRLQ